MKKQKKIALVLGVTGQDGSFIAKLLIKKIIRCMDSLENLLREI